MLSTISTRLAHSVIAASVRGSRVSYRRVTTQTAEYLRLCKSGGKEKVKIAPCGKIQRQDHGNSCAAASRYFVFPFLAEFVVLSLSGIRAIGRLFLFMKTKFNRHFLYAMHSIQLNVFQISGKRLSPDRAQKCPISSRGSLARTNVLEKFTFSVLFATRSFLL